MTDTRYVANPDRATERGYFYASASALAPFRLLPVLLLWFRLLRGQRSEYDHAPKAGPVRFFPEEALKPGMKGVAWTVFPGQQAGTGPGRNHRGVAERLGTASRTSSSAKLTGKAERTNVAGGMSGSPVYIDGKLVGAIFLATKRFLARCDLRHHANHLMMEVNEFDKTRPAEARTPDKYSAKRPRLADAGRTACPRDVAPVRRIELPETAR